MTKVFCIECNMTSIINSIKSSLFLGLNLCCIFLLQITLQSVVSLKYRENKSINYRDHSQPPPFLSVHDFDWGICLVAYRSFNLLKRRAFIYSTV